MTDEIPHKEGGWPGRLWCVALVLGIYTLIVIACQAGYGSAVEKRLGMESWDPARACIWAIVVNELSHEVAVAWSPYPCKDSIHITTHKYVGERPPCEVWVMSPRGTGKPLVSGVLCRAPTPSFTRGGEWP